MRIADREESELFPYYGATGQVGLIDGYVVDGEYVLLGEDGAPFLDYEKDIAYLVNGKCWVNNHAHILRSLLNNQFLLHYLNQFDFHGFVSGTTRLKLTQGSMRKITVSVTPLPEQRGIVAKIEQLFSELDAGIAYLKAAQDHLKVYRQAVLKKAFEGEFVDATFDVIPIKEIAESVTYGTSQKAKKVGTIPVLRMGNLQNGMIDYSNLKFQDTLLGVEELDLKNGDILFNRTNSAELVGKTSIFSGHVKYGQIIYASYLIRVRVDQEKIVPEYLNYWMNSPEAAILKNKLKNQQVGQANINGTKLKNMEFPFADDLEIQKQIVQEIETRLSVCDNIEANIKEALTKAKTLRQSILKKAFEGKLLDEEELGEVRSAPDWEPAEKLLERIKANKKKPEVMA